MNKRLIGIIGMSLFFLTGCGEEEPVRVPDPTEQRKVKAEIFNKADNI